MFNYKCLRNFFCQNSYYAATWWEQNGALQTCLSLECKIITFIQKKEFIGNNEVMNCIEKNEKSVGLGIFVNAISYT